MTFSLSVDISPEIIPAFHELLDRGNYCLPFQRYILELSFKLQFSRYRRDVFPKSDDNGDQRLHNLTAEWPIGGNTRNTCSKWKESLLGQKIDLDNGGKSLWNAFLVFHFEQECYTTFSQTCRQRKIFFQDFGSRTRVELLNSLLLLWVLPLPNNRAENPGEG